MGQNPRPRVMTIESVLHELTLFRKSRKGRCRIPEELWRKAVHLCQTHPVGRVHRELRLGYKELKSRVLKKGIDPSIKRDISLPFVELKIPPIEQSPGLPDSQYLIELSRTDGTRMRIYSSKNEPLNMNSLCSTFLKS